MDLSGNIVALGVAQGESSPLNVNQVNELIVPALQMMVRDKYGSIAAGAGDLLDGISSLSNSSFDDKGTGWALLNGGGVLQGTTGNDTLDGGANSFIKAGDGDDIVVGVAQSSIIDGGDGSDAIKGSGQADWLLGGAGNDWINGRGGNDIIIGGAGNDTVGGGAGDDIYRFARGDGQDTIIDGIDYWDGGSGGNDIIELGAGIAADQVTVSQRNNGKDLFLDLGQGDSILISGSPIIEGGNQIEQVKFADGTIWTHADLISYSSISGALSAANSAQQLAEASAAFSPQSSAWVVAQDEKESSPAMVMTFNNRGDQRLS